jgi:hypothetical protein
MDEQQFNELAAFRSKLRETVDGKVLTLAFGGLALIWFFRDASGTRLPAFLLYPGVLLVVALICDLLGPLVQYLVYDDLVGLKDYLQNRTPSTWRHRLIRLVPSKPTTVISVRPAGPIFATKLLALVLGYLLLLGYLVANLRWT